MSEFTEYRLHFPRDLTPDDVLGVLLAINGAGGKQARPLWLSVRGVGGRLEHRLGVAGNRLHIIKQLPLLLPGLRLEDAEPIGGLAQANVWRLWQSTSRRPLRNDHPDLTTRAILTALLNVHRGEWLELRWQFGPVQRPQNVGSSHSPMLSESWPLALTTAAVRAPGDLDADARQALRRKPRGALVAAARPVGRRWHQ